MGVRMLPGGAELGILAVITWGLVAYCLVDLAKRRGAPRATMWTALLAIGIVVWPVAWVAGAKYLVSRRRERAPQA